MIRNYEGIEYECSNIHSHKDFTNIPRVAIRDGLVVYASCFSQEIPDSHIFRDDMEGVTFIKCNLMNVYIPPGNTVIDCQTQRFKVQRDSRDWFLNDADEPIEVTNKKDWERKGYSVDPADIPTENPINTEEMPRKRYDRLFGQNGPGHPVFVGTPDIVDTKVVRSMFIVTDDEIEELELQNVFDITAIELSRMSDVDRYNFPIGKKIVEADVEFVEVEGEGRMFNNVERIRRT